MDRDVVCRCNQDTSTRNDYYAFTGSQRAHALSKLAGKWGKDDMLMGQQASGTMPASCPRGGKEAHFPQCRLVMVGLRLALRQGWL